MTLPAEQVTQFADILNEGVWPRQATGANTGSESDAGVSVDAMTHMASQFTVTPPKLDAAKQLVDQVLQRTANGGKVAGTLRDSDRTLPLLSVGSYTHNCAAPLLLNCGHTPGHCRACPHYRPDTGTEDHHQVEIFREMLYYFECRAVEKTYHITGQRTMIFQKSQQLKARLDKTETILWRDQFGLSPTEARTRHRMLWTRARAYYRDHGQTAERPSADEILGYLTMGEDG